MTAFATPVVLLEGQHYRVDVPYRGMLMHVEGVDVGRWEPVGPAGGLVQQITGLIPLYLGNDRPEVMPLTLKPMPPTEVHFGSVFFPVLAGGPPPPEPPPVRDERAPGDYPGSLSAGSVPTVRDEVYRALANVRGVADFFNIANPAAQVATVSIWLNGVLVEPGVMVPAGQSVADRLHLFVDPGGLIEMRSDVAGVLVHISGIEEVGL